MNSAFGVRGCCAHIWLLLKPTPAASSGLPQPSACRSQGKTRRAEKLRHRFLHPRSQLFPSNRISSRVGAAPTGAQSLVAGCCTGSTAGRGCTGTACARCTPGKAAQTAKNRFHSPPPSVETGFFSTKLTPKCN